MRITTPLAARPSSPFGRALPGLGLGRAGLHQPPEYERALGALEGMPGPCNMSVEEARRIVAAQGNRPGGLLGRIIGGSPPPVADPYPAERERGHRNNAVNR